MKFRTIGLGILVFLLVGELLIRFDKRVGPFAKDNRVMIGIKMQESPELKMVKENKIPLDDSTYRIMVLGDSYIYGAALSEANKFSTRLKENLLKNTNSKYKRCFVLDVSRPANNTLDNYNTYKEFNNRLKPQLVILAYNLNDVSNNLDPQDTTRMERGELPVKQADKPSFVKRVYNVLYTSQVIQFTMHNINDYLKSIGYIFPNSVFDQELKAYTQNRPNWVKSKQILDKLIEETNANQENLMVIRMPEYNLLDYHGLCKQTDGIIDGYFTSHKNVQLIDPNDYYRNYHSKDLSLNKYDGHPNEKAHQLLANGVINYIDSNCLKN